MSNESLENKFNEAVAFMNSFTAPLPADTLLRLYAFYKIANGNFENPGSRKPLINAFKVNALIQAKNLEKKEAMEGYITLVNSEIKKNQS